MARNKGDKDYTKSEKQLLISLINDYSLFEDTDNEIIQMLSKKLGKKISETLFYRLKKEAMKRRGDMGEWLDFYSRHHFVEHYRKRIEELEFVQKKILASETEKEEEEKQNKSLINQLAKTIADNSKVLAEFGLAPPILAKIKSMIPLDISTISSNDKNIIYNEKRLVNENEKAELISSRNAKSAIFPPMDNTNYHAYDHQDNELLTDTDDPNRVF